MASSGRGKAGPAPEIYECSPPEWLPQISSNSDLGMQDPSDFNPVNNELD